MMKFYFVLLGLVVLGCNQPAAVETTGNFTDAPAGAQRTPYPGNPDLVSVVQTGTDGKVIQQGDYYKGVRSGTWTEYYPNGVIKTISGYRDGKLHGTYLSIDNRGGLIEKVDFVEGKKSGVYYKYERGKIVHEMTYMDDVIHGPFKRYYSNGNVQEESNYANGVLDGQALWYDQQGNVTIEYTYANGELVDDGTSN